MGDPNTADCTACGLVDCPSRPGGQTEGEAGGTALALAAATTFLLPLLCALAAAAAVDGGEGWRLLATVGGLLLGALASRRLVRRSCS